MWKFDTKKLCCKNKAVETNALLALAKVIGAYTALRKKCSLKNGNEKMKDKKFDESR